MASFAEKIEKLRAKADSTPFAEEAKLLRQKADQLAEKDWTADYVKRHPNPVLRLWLNWNIQEFGLQAKRWRNGYLIAGPRDRVIQVANNYRQIAKALK